MATPFNAPVQPVQMPPDVANERIPIESEAHIMQPMAAREARPGGFSNRASMPSERVSPGSVATLGLPWMPPPQSPAQSVTSPKWSPGREMIRPSPLEPHAWSSLGRGMSKELISLGVPGSSFATAMDSPVWRSESPAKKPTRQNTWEQHDPPLHAGPTHLHPLSRGLEVDSPTREVATYVGTLGYGSEFSGPTSLAGGMTSPPSGSNVKSQFGLVDQHCLGQSPSFGSSYSTITPNSEQWLVAAQPWNAKPHTKSARHRSDRAGSDNISSHSATSSSSGVSKAALKAQHSSTDSLMSHYTVTRELGVGSFSRVFLVRERHLGQERVGKRVNTHGRHQRVLEWLKMEIDLLCNLDHPHIVKLYEYSEDVKKEQLVLILEFLAGENCKDLIENSGPLSEDLAAHFIRQSLTALAYCHSRGIMHRDIKPENIMLTSSAKYGRPDCKLIDFGLAAYAGGASLSNHVGPLPFHSSCETGRGLAGEFVGTPPYMPPEIVRKDTRDFSLSDMWSIGISTIEMVTGQCPFGKLADFAKNPEPIYDRIKHYQGFEEIELRLKSNKLWERCSPQLKDFVKELLSPIPEQRSSAANALAHPWLELHREPPASLTVEMMRSMKDYSIAHPLLRACLHIVLARTKELDDAERMACAFTSMDNDHDGEITEEDLSQALEEETGWFTPEVHVKDLMLAADTDNSGGLSYSEFAMACLWNRQASVPELLRSAFRALDKNRDGLVEYQDVVKVFRDDDAPSFRFLPDMFTLKEWLHCMQGCISGTDAELRDARPSRGVKKPLGSSSSGIFDWFLYKCSAGDGCMAVEYYA